jgi:tetratricopeptide (TPR) repeat protein
MLFMSIIQLKYENDLNSAALYAERLNREYPDNMFFQGHLVTILLHQHRYGEVRKVMEHMAGQEDSYSEMIRHLAWAFMDEKERSDELAAGEKYLKTIELADSIGPFADLFKAMGYMGLSRINEARGMHEESRRYARKASNLTVYSYILNE